MRLLLPAWLGSIGFHLCLLFLFLCYLHLQPGPPSAPGDRLATGGIVLKQESQEGLSYVDSQNNQYGEASPTQSDEPTEAPSLEQVLSGTVGDLTSLKSLLPDKAGHAQAMQNATKSVVAGSQLAETLRGGSKAAGMGYELGGTVSVKVFNLEGKGTKFVYVFDRSGSMGEYVGKPIRAAKEQLIQSLQPLNKFHQFNIIFYNEKSYPWQPGKMLFATEINKENARKFVAGITPMGGTKHRDPLVAAIKLKPDVIFFLTDGDENDAMPPGQVQEVQRLNNIIGAGAQINVIQFGIGEHRHSRFLADLAAQNRGQYTYVNIAGL